LRNAGSGTLTIDPDSTETVDDQVTLQINPGESLILVCNAVEWYTVGYGRSMLYQFTQLTKDLTAGGTITLSDSESSNKLFKFTGTPAGTVNVVVPAVVAVYYVYNAFSSAQSINLKTASGASAAIGQGQRAIVFCDGTDVLAAQTATISGDLSLTDGTAASPSLKFATSTNTGLHKYGASGLGFSVAGSLAGFFGTAGFTVSSGYLQLPSNTSPSQTAEGAMVWDNDSDLLVIGTGASQKTMVDTSSTQTVANKTLASTNMTVDTRISGVLVLPSGTGDIGEAVTQWNSSTDHLTIGSGSAIKTLVNADDVIAIAQGGTGQASKTPAFDALAPTTAKGDLIVYNGTDNIRLAVGTNGQFVSADSAEASGLKWASLPAGEVTLTNAVTIQNKKLQDSILINYAEYDNGNKTGATAIAWVNGQRQKMAMTGSCTVTFDWTGCEAGTYILVVSMTNSSAYTITWSTGTPASTSWIARTSAPSLYTGGSGRKTIFCFYYDGTNVIGSGDKVGSV
jgi:hypothetical protein